MRHVPDLYPPERCVYLAAEAFADNHGNYDGLSELLRQGEIYQYVRGLILPAALCDNGAYDSLERIRSESKPKDSKWIADLEIILDLQLAGRGEGMASRLGSIVRRFGWEPQAVTFARGVSRNELRDFRGKFDRGVGMLLTGVLPEVDAEDLHDLSAEGHTAKELTLLIGHMSMNQQIEACGVYGAAVYAEVVKSREIPYLGVGISLDGQSYTNKHGRLKVGMGAGQALKTGNTALGIGNAIAGGTTDVDVMTDRVMQFGGQIVEALPQRTA